MVDVLSTLQECSWRKISFPVTAIVESCTQDMPQHKAADRDGAFVEGTGRNPFVYSVTAVLVAGTIAKGKNETWTDLYPGTFNKLRSAWADRTTGELIHPLYGPIKCKPSDWKASLNAGERGGQTVELGFIETRDDGVTPAFSTSEMSYAKTTALELDSQIAKLKPKPSVFGPQDTEQSFYDTVLSIVGVVDATTLQAKQALAKVDSAIYKLDRLSGSINRAADVVVVDAVSGVTTNLGRLGPGSGRIWTNCQTLRSAMTDVRRRLTVTDASRIRTFVTAKNTTIVGLSVSLGCSVAELLSLNPGLPRTRPAVSANTLIRYYVKR